MRAGMALCRFVWNATFTVLPVGGHPSPALPAGGKGASRPLPSGLPAKNSVDRQPFGERLTLRDRVKAKPFGWPTASLDPAAHRAPVLNQPRHVTVAFHTKRRGAAGMRGSNLFSSALTTAAWPGQTAARRRTSR